MAGFRLAGGFTAHGPAQTAPAASNHGLPPTWDGALNAEQRVVQMRQHLVPVRVLQALACAERGPPWALGFGAVGG